MLPRSRTGRLFASLLLVAASLVVAGMLAELVLRIAPIPGITYHTFYFDALTGERFYPHTTMIYRNARGDDVRRRVNGWGYLDVEHKIQKPPGVVRIGFFGDSFTEARQIPQDGTFPRRIERGLNQASNGQRYECIAIAVSGFGTTQCYLECRRWMRKLSLDHVFYVFCENDPGNNIPSLNMSDRAPYPVLVGDSLVIDYSFAARYAYKQRLPHRVWQYLKSHTLLFSTLETRIHLLRGYGLKMRVTRAERMMEPPVDRETPISANSLPSALPDSLRLQCEVITERVLLAWKRLVDAGGATFDILYVPREGQMAKPVAEQDSWKPWLSAFCRSHDIGFIDPTERFVRAESQGDKMYYDHLTSDGHAEMAAAFLDQFRYR